MNVYELLGGVKLLIKQGKTIDEALIETNAQPDDAEWVRSALADPVIAADPAAVLSKKNNNISKCKPDAFPKPNSYLFGFETFCANVRRWKQPIITNPSGSGLRETSARIVERLPDPKASHNFRVKGLVIGYVQSGKTANMAALISRAADEGYRLIIVLAGIYNDLRAQTQVRMDQDVAGKSEDPNDGPFVKHAAELAKWGRLTTANLDGDFWAGTIQDFSHGTPKIAVIKKRVDVLDRLTQWLKTVASLDKTPVLVIDDEADQASINSNYAKVDDDGNEVNPSKTNEAIRELLRSLPKVVYVGFTATPFANVLIDLTEKDDLFPEDFIISLEQPVGYFGARQLFGLGMTPSATSPEPSQDATIDVISPITPDDAVALENLTGDGDCPDVLRKALLMFLLGSATRLQRKQHDHFSMFVHPSHKQDVHAKYAAVMQRELERLKTQCANIDKYPSTVAELKDLWDNDFTPTTEKIDPGLAVQFKAVKPFLRDASKETVLKVLNQGSEDRLEYKRSGPRQRYVVIGGNRLSRGLTLEGLSVSVFLRDTNYYDTLLQMGRWFGFRKGYADLTRVFVDDQSAEDFADLARIELELRNDIRKYAEGNRTPAEIAPLIRSHKRMLVTAPNKHGAAKAPKLIMRNEKQVVKFPFGAPGALEANKETARLFVKGLGKPTTTEVGWHVWRGRPASEILGFIAKYRFASVRVMNAEVLRDSIQSEPDLMDTWDIVIAGKPNKASSFEWSKDIRSGMVSRQPLTPHSISVLREREHSSRWRADEDRCKCALFLYCVNPKFTGGGKKRFFRDDVELVAPAFLFPSTGDAPITIADEPQYVTQRGTKQ